MQHVVDLYGMYVIQAPFCVVVASHLFDLGPPTVQLHPAHRVISWHPGDLYDVILGRQR